MYLWDAGVNSRHSTCQTVALALKTPILNCLLDFIRPPIFIITNTCVFKVCENPTHRIFSFWNMERPMLNFYCDTKRTAS